MSAGSAMASRGECLRAIACFGLFAVLLSRVGRELWQLQMVEESAVAAAATVEQRRTQTVHEAPGLGPILDRHRRVLAEDLPAQEVRAELYVTVREGAAGREQMLIRVASLCQALAGALGDAGEAAPGVLWQRALQAMDRRPPRSRGAAPAGRPARETHKIDFLVAREVTSAGAILALRELELAEEWRGALHLHFFDRHRRVYPGSAAGSVVGLVARRGEQQEVRTGLEALAGLRAGSEGLRRRLRAPGKRLLWIGDGTPAQRAGCLVTTLDLDLQDAAQRELEAAVADVSTTHGGPPLWGALVLVGVERGEVLAMASYIRGVEGPGAAFAPTQRIFEPGSVVKPLWLSVLLAHRGIRWDSDVVDCTTDRTWTVDPPGLPPAARVVTDDHSCGVLPPHQVIAQSSNIGAVRLGFLFAERMGWPAYAEALEFYADSYGLGRAVGFGMAGEAAGRRTRDIGRLSTRQLAYYTGTSFSFGYEMSVTAVQMARAYLSLLSGRARPLRLIDAFEYGGERIEPDVADPGPRFLSDDDLTRLRRAMTDVVRDDPHATARHLARELQRMGVPEGLIGGKTGTSVFRAKQVRTASFAGFAPAAAPRFVAFCVLQQVCGEGFYGGRYASVPAGRLLLRALASEREEGDRTGQARSVRAAALVRGGERPALHELGGR